MQSQKGDIRRRAMVLSPVKSALHRDTPAQVPMPGGDVFVGQPGSHVKHDNGTLPVNVIAIPKPTELLLTSCVPAVETDRTTVCKEIERVDLHSDRCCT